MTTPESLLLAEGVSKRYRIRSERSLALGLRRKHRPREHWALRELDFDVRPGEVVAVVGRNGAGKSTLLKIAAGVTTPTTGRLRRPERIAPLIEVGAGFHPEMTGRENVEVNGRLLGIGPKEIRGAFDRIVEFAELEESIDRPVREYSSGMFMRLGFSVAIHTRPDLLIVDEVLAVGDMPFQVRCLERIRDLRAEGVGVLFVSHNLTAVQSLADRAIFLDQGMVQARGTAAEVIGAYHAALNERVVAQDGAKGSGRGDLEVVSVAVEDLQGGTKSVWQPGDRAVVRVRLRARVETPRAAVGFTVTKEGSGLVARCIAEAGPFIPPLPVDAEWQIDIALGLNFTDGGYLVELAVADAETRRLLLDLTFVHRFGMAGRVGVTGLVDVAPEFTIHPHE